MLSSTTIPMDRTKVELEGLKASFDTIIFDVGNVLLRFEMEEADNFLATTLFANEIAQGIHDFSYYIDSIYGSDEWKQFDQGLLSDAEVASRLGKKLPCAPEKILTLIEKIKGAWTPMFGSIKLLNTLSELGFNLYALTNMPASVQAHLQASFSFYEKFNGIVASGCVKIKKPDKQIYLHLLELTKLNPKKAIFIDDISQNLIPAQDLGIKTIHFTDLTACVSELKQLASLAKVSDTSVTRFNVFQRPPALAAPLHSDEQAVNHSLNPSRTTQPQ